MTISRRRTLKTIGTIGVGAAFTGEVLASGSGSGDKADDHEEADDRPAEEADDQAGEAAVRVAHFSPDAPNVDVYVDGDQVLSDVAYRDVSPYLELAPATYTVTITAAGDPETVAFEGDVTVDAATYTIAAIGELEAETFEPLVLVDETAEGETLARVVHASPDAPAVDVFVAGTDEPLFANVAFGEATDYIEVPAGEVPLEIRPAGAAPEDGETDREKNSGSEEHDDAEPAGDVVATVDAVFEADTAYSAFAIGYLEPPAEVEDRDFEVRLEVDGQPAAEMREEPEEPEEREPEESEEPEEREPEEPKEPEEPDEDEDDYAVA